MFKFTIYPNNLKIWEFGKKAPQIFYPAREAVFEDTVRARDEKYGEKPTKPKTKFSSCLGISIDVEPWPWGY